MALVFLVAFEAFAQAQSWQLKDMGVGLVIEDAEYDTVLKIAERGAVWDAKELYEKGAFAGKYKGNQRFAAWIQGPVQDVALWDYAYTITYPDGKTASFGRYGFYRGGHGTVSLSTGSYTEGKWKIEFTIWNRKTNEARSVGSVEFSTTWGRPQADSWQLLDAGVGLFDQTNYDTELVILERGTRWSQKWLYEQGYLANRSKTFGTWIKGPPIATFTDASGNPRWLYAVTLTAPNGAVQEFGPSYFYAPGFAAMVLNVASGAALGHWRIDYYLVRRGSGEKTAVSSLSFTITE